jgi:hypothetical protein
VLELRLEALGIEQGNLATKTRWLVERGIKTD